MIRGETLPPLPAEKPMEPRRPNRAQLEGGDVAPVPASRSRRRSVRGKPHAWVGESQATSLGASHTRSESRESKVESNGGRRARRPRGALRGVSPHARRGSGAECRELVRAIWAAICADLRQAAVSPSLARLNNRSQR